MLVAVCVLVGGGEGTAGVHQGAVVDSTSLIRVCGIYCELYVLFVLCVVYDVFTAFTG